MANRLLRLVLAAAFLLLTAACTEQPPPEGIPEPDTGSASAPGPAASGSAGSVSAPEHTAPAPAESAVSGSGDREETPMNKISVSFNGYTYTATLADNSSAQAFAGLLRQNGGALTVEMSDYGSFEKVGSLGTTLPRNDEQITTSAGDIILYQGNSITVYYARNSWSFTRLGRLDDPSGLREALGDGTVSITFQLAEE